MVVRQNRGSLGREADHLELVNQPRPRVPVDTALDPGVCKIDQQPTVSQLDSRIVQVLISAVRAILLGVAPGEFTADKESRPDSADRHLAFRQAALVSSNHLQLERTVCVEPTHPSLLILIVGAQGESGRGRVRPKQVRKPLPNDRGIESRPSRTAALSGSGGVKAKVARREHPQ